ncbi:MAG TPA: hypothetical protein VF458_22585, partial [Ktedonobacteraceae bacterium]
SCMGFSFHFLQHLPCAALFSGAARGPGKTSLTFAPCPRCAMRGFLRTLSCFSNKDNVSHKEMQAEERTVPNVSMQTGRMTHETLMDGYMVIWLNVRWKHWRSFVGEKSITRRFAVTIQIQA